MKVVLLSGTLACAAFFGAAWQFGLLSPIAAPEPKVEKPAPIPKAKFPEDLAPSARAKPVPQAKGYALTEKPCKIVFLRTNGTVLEKWQEQLEGRHDDWMANSVEETELAVIVGVQKRNLVERVPFPNAPPVERNRYEVEASVVDAKTGKVLANRLFVNEPRPMRAVETWSLTAVGHAVTWRPVFQWVATHSTTGFKHASGPPIVNVAD